MRRAAISTSKITDRVGDLALFMDRAGLRRARR